ncbi:mitogen-activated protein kinase kinase kinase 18-like [Phragmites australis]|uniref:mitogen-activated protein kinase kinase kinase 18-like n=1 Tax=Phragmites australis TaxID=29695 RepID=UPI002D768FA3|nr:mitogen-activated protein kinase kinase kinase 18-like [Phragmites australis]
MEWLRGKCIGMGAFGTVHLAVDGATGRAFAVKSVDTKSAPAAAVACLESEIRILKRLSSPYVVAYLGDGATQKTRELHMELVPGGSAAEAAARLGGLGERGVRGVMWRVAAALRYLHDFAGVVHGDVKGRNVLVGCDAVGGGAKLADFGTARLVSEAAPRGPLGTPAWMAPEVARGGATTPASDVWSLGCTALELLTGKRPWSELGGACEVGELLLLIGFGGKRPALPACLSDSCRDFLDKCLRRDTDQRWTCEQLLRHPFLSADAHDDGIEPSPSPSPRAVLDWVVADSDSEALDDPEPENEHEVMARAKRRVAELASNGPLASWVELEWGTDPTWALLKSSEAPRTVPSTSDADAGNGNAGGPASRSAAASTARDKVVVGSNGGGGGFCCVHGRPSCHSHCCHYKFGLGVVGLGWPPLAVVPVLVPLYCCYLIDSIQSTFMFNIIKQPMSFACRFGFRLILTEIAADRVMRPRLVDPRVVRLLSCIPASTISVSIQGSKTKGSHSSCAKENS